MTQKTAREAFLDYLDDTPEEEVTHEQDHDYIPLPGTEQDDFGPLMCRYCRIPAEGESMVPLPVSEFERKRNRLATFLYVTAYDYEYGDSMWDGQDRRLIANYRADATNILRRYPHLLSHGERERLGLSV